MLTLEQMLCRFAVALVLGAVLGIERELVKKDEAGIRTEMLVAGGSALFAMASLSLPYLVATSPENLNALISNGGFLGMIAGVTSGIGFLGAGIIIKINDHPHGVTTAALVWTTAALGVSGRYWPYRIRRHLRHCPCGHPLPVPKDRHRCQTKSS